jgi:hypothetical protein
MPMIRPPTEAETVKLRRIGVARNLLLVVVFAGSGLNLLMGRLPDRFETLAVVVSVMVGCAILGMFIYVTCLQRCPRCEGWVAIAKCPKCGLRLDALNK